MTMEFGIFVYLVPPFIIGVVIILVSLFPIYVNYSTLKRSNLSWNDLESYENVKIITAHHIIVKNYLHVDSLISIKDIKNLIGDKIHKHNDWLIFDLDLFDDVEIKEPDRKITFQFKRLKFIDDFSFSFDEDERSEFEEASRILKSLMEKLKEKREKQGIEEKERIFIPLIGDALDYINRSPIEFYTWGRIAFGAVFYLLLSLFISTPAYSHYSWASPQVTYAKFILGIKIFIVFLIILISGGIGILEALSLFHSKLRFRTESVYPVKMMFSDHFFYLMGGIIMAVTQWVVMMALNLKSGWFYLTGGVLLIIVMGFYFSGYFSHLREIKKEANENYLQEEK